MNAIDHRPSQADHQHHQHQQPHHNHMQRVWREQVGNSNPNDANKLIWMNEISDLIIFDCCWWILLSQWSYVYRFCGCCGLLVLIVSLMLSQLETWMWALSVQAFMHHLTDDNHLIRWINLTNKLKICLKSKFFPDLDRSIVLDSWNELPTFFFAPSIKFLCFWQQNH